MKYCALLCAVIIFATCKKDNENYCLGCGNLNVPASYFDRLSGQFLVDCKGAYDQNDEVIISLRIFGPGLLTIKEDTLLTNANGQFQDSLSFTVPSFFYDHFSIAVELPRDSVIIYVGSPQNQNIYIQNVISDSARFVIKLDALNRYTSADTLFYNISNGNEATPFYYLVGPFRDTILNEVSFPFRKLVITPDSVFSYLNWGLGFWAFNNEITTPTNPIKIAVKHSVCSAVDTAEIVLR